MDEAPETTGVSNIMRPGYSTLIIMGIAIIGIVLAYFIARPFVAAIVWSVTLALLLVPFNERLKGILRSPNLAATVTAAFAAFVVVVPTIMVSGALLNEVIRNIGQVPAMADPDYWVDWAQGDAVIITIINWLDGRLDMSQIIRNATEWLTSWSGNVILGSVSGVFTLLITFYFLFYLLRDWKIAIATLEDMLPFEDREFSLLAQRVNDTVFASVYGTIVVAAIQGALGGLMFWWLGLPSPIFWGVLMGLLAVVPFLGAFVIWVPAVVVLLINGQIFSAVLLCAWGTIIVGLIDNIAYPILVGRRLKLHSAPSFVAIMGGLVLFGPSGIVLGPIIFAVSQSLLIILRERVAKEDAVNSAADKPVKNRMDAGPTG